MPLDQAPTSEEFLQWRDHPVTKWAFRAVQAAAEAQKAGWLTQSWEANNPDPLVLCELRTRADAYLALYETPYEMWCELNGQEPRHDV